MKEFAFSHNRDDVAGRQENNFLTASNWNAFQNLALFVIGRCRADAFGLIRLIIIAL